MSTVPSTTITKVAGLLLGAIACTVLLVAPRISRPAGALDAALTMTATPTGELGITPKGTVLKSARLAPGGRPARASLTVRNQTGVPLAVTLAARPASGDLDDVARLRIRTADTTLFDGTPARLRAGTAPLRLQPGEGRRLRITASVPRQASADAQGRADEIALELRSSPVGSAP